MKSLIRRVAGRNHTNMNDHFSPVGEVSVDDRTRLALGKAGVRKDDRYAVAVSDDGEILLTPLVSIPKRELFLWENPEVRESLARGFEQIARGETVILEDLSSYLVDHDSDD